MSCACKPCEDCEGSGNVWYALDGTYLGNKRCDDCDHLERCERCSGSGTEQMCEDCQQQEEELDWEEGE